MYIIIRYELSYMHCEPLIRIPLKIAQRRNSTSITVNDMKVNNGEETWYNKYLCNVFVLTTSFSINHDIHRTYKYHYVTIINRINVQSSLTESPTTDSNNFIFTPILFVNICIYGLNFKYLKLNEQFVHSTETKVCEFFVIKSKI